MKQSIKSTIRAAKQEDARARKASLVQGTGEDSYVNFSAKLGIGADNPLTAGTYGYNPITRNRIQLEWIHRGSWLGGVAIDLVADDMTRAGVDFLTDIEPDQQEKMEHSATRLNVWSSINEIIKWSRLYGGCLGVVLIDGQDLKTPLRLETIQKDQFKGVLPIDRWMADPSLEDLVTDFGPNLGLPKFYTINSSAPALKGAVVHHSRCVLRLEGVQLPMQQRLTENLWGLSVLERIFDRMIAFDSASTGAAQLVFKSFLRTLKVEGLRDIVSAGNKAMSGLLASVDLMRRFQGNEGITLIDMKDEFDVQISGAMSGMDDILTQLGQQLSGALQIPLVRLFGQSPAGLNSSGESDLRMFYDHIRQQQRKYMLVGVTTIYQLLARSEGIKLPDDFAIDFTSLWDLDDSEKATVSKTTTDAITAALDGGLITQQGAMKELRQSARTTGIFTNITKEMIDQGDDQLQPPEPEAGAGMEDMPGENDPLSGLPTKRAPDPLSGVVPKRPAAGAEETQLSGDTRDGARTRKVLT